MKLTAIVAASDNGVIGRSGELPWRLPADLARFKRLTLGKPVLMGRRTHESIGRPLPGRLNVVVTSGGTPEGCVGARTIDEALELSEVAKAPEVMVIGGAQLYAEALRLCDELLLTRVHGSFEGDAFFHFDPEGWELVAREEIPADEKNAYATTFETWRRVGKGE
ncbi:dihydrofolate reductase [Vulgatibacter incomptus]|uniref:Dihydrofolate reductase n=1 Tax=Vulgatibacter incomptus TaxID=1391653 RepID=A0A0K1P9M2_9BACT|nr:dihydrofolate reductase [Vulgatibacter incomptus]AKU90136.1 Dihydrofolate reductase [Vulgatibacter incomptus]